MGQLPAPPGLQARLVELFPDARILGVRALGDDDETHAKAHGYGRPLRVTFETGDSSVREIVFHTIRADDFGHDRRADRIANAVLAYDTYGRLPHHVGVLDVGVLGPDRLISVADSTEPYFITPWCAGTTYAGDLHQVAMRGAASDLDLARLDTIVDALHDIHGAPGSHPEAYTRAIRDLLGHGEGIFGLIDSYADDVPGAPATRLRRIEQACHAWRWQLRRRTERLRRIHGDFHPFNIVFDGDTKLTLLDASRGAEGDPADDVACLAINFVFFGLGDARPNGLATLWTRFWARYLATSSVDVLAAAAPFFAWRGLVLASPRWYPDLAPSDRERLLDFIERTLASERFDPAWGVELLR